MATSSHTDADAFVAELVKGKLARLCDGIIRNGSSYFAVPCGLVFYLVVSEETRVEGQNALRPRLFVDTDVDSERAGPFGSVGETNEVLRAERAHHLAHKHGWLSYEDDCLVTKTPAFDTFIQSPCAQSDVTARVLALFDEARALTVCPCGEWFAFGGAETCISCRAAAFSRLQAAGTCAVCHEQTVQRTTGCCKQPMHAPCAGKTKRAKLDATCPLCRKGTWCAV